jgi:hypothetical protein
MSMKDESEGFDAETTSSVHSNEEEKSIAQSTNKVWINLEDRYLVPRTFLENCVIFIERNGTKVVLKTVDPHEDLILNMTNETEAISTFRRLYKIFINEEIQSNLAFDDE